MQLQFSHPSISDSEFVERIEQKKASFYRVAFGYTRNEDDALEVVQEAVCKAYTAKWRLRDPERFYPWFYRILTNTAPLSFLRRRPPQGAVQEAWDALPAEDGEERWADSLWLREELGRLASAQTGVPARCAVKVGKAPAAPAAAAPAQAAEHDKLDDLLAFSRQFDNIIIQE